MVIEWLKVSVPLALQAQYLDADDLIWTKTLAQQPGFAGKECWRDSVDPETLHLIIRWQSRAAWTSVPRSLLDATEQAFVAALGAEFPILACLTYDVIR
jgi:uncharacterized protein (TIGR03792 family)